MGLFLNMIIFPGGAGEECRRAFEQCPKEPDLNICQRDCYWSQYAKGAAVRLNDFGIGYYLLEPLSQMLDCPLLLLYIYDDDYWGYHLWQHGRELDKFASLRDYFGELEPEGDSLGDLGDVQLLAHCFGVEPERIKGYLVPWAEDEMGRFAYPPDEFAIGDCWQLADFMAALGFAYNQLCPPPEEPQKLEKPQEPEKPKKDWAENWTENFNESKEALEFSDPPNYSLPPANVLPVDTPILPDALNDRGYILQRAAGLGQEYANIVRLMENGEYGAAVPLLTQTIQTGDDEPVLYLLRAFCWSQLECLTSGRNRRPDMDRDLTRVLEREPDNVMALRAHCPTTGTTMRYKRHIQELTRLMELDLENLDIYQVSRAYRYHWVGDDVSAQADLRAVLERGQHWTVDLVYLCREFCFPGF